MRNSRREGRVRPRGQAGKESAGTNAPVAVLRGPRAAGAASYEWMGIEDCHKMRCYRKRDQNEVLRVGG
jgi:hypothetical protein